MKINILFGGKAGQGVNEIATIVSEILVNNGFFVFNYRDYPSLIRGGHNFNIISVSDEQILSHENNIDIIVAIDEKTATIHSSKLKKNGFLISNKLINADNIIQEHKIDKKTRNIIFAGALFKFLGLDIELLLDKLKEKFGNKPIIEDNIKAASLGYNSIKENANILPKVKKKKLYFLSGTEGVAIGAINSGIDVYFAYPMTPATPVLHKLAERQIKDNFIVVQLENEIAVINAALGASFTGAKVMIGTSGGGFDLMTEALSMQGMSEIPLVIYLAQRPGPGTGVPTYTMQSDLNVALYSGHGEFPRVVIAPGDAFECIEKTNEAFYFAQKYRLASIILSDKHIAESYYTFYRKKPRILRITPEIKKTQGLFKNYRITPNGNSPRSVPGQSIVKASSYEHDEYGFTVEDERTIKKMFEKRFRKWETIKREVRKFRMYCTYNRKESKNLLLGWGSTKGAIIDSIRDIDIKFLQILYLKPFPREIKKELEKSEKIIIVENNATGLLRELIRKETGIEINKRNMILKYDGRPFTPNELKKEILMRIK